MHTVEEGDQTMEEAKELRLFAKEFGQGVRQQRVRGKTQEKAGTLPLAISMMKRIIAPQTQSLNTLEELQGLTKDVVITWLLGRLWKTTELFFQKEKLSLLSITTGRIWSLFFLAIVCEDLHSRNDCFSKEKLKINWLKQSEEDPLVYNEGNFDDQNSLKCILDRVSVDQEAEQFT